jgi:hypothetical protein
MYVRSLCSGLLAGQGAGCQGAAWTLPEQCDNHFSAVAVATDTECADMKATVNFECTPEEARAFLGLPDVTEPNKIYVEKLTAAMTTVSSLEQMQEYAKQMAPVGQAGLRMFQQLMEKGAGAAFSGFTGAKSRKRNSGDE